MCDRSGFAAHFLIGFEHRDIPCPHNAPAC